MREKISILTAHFGDFEWTEFLLQRVYETVDSSLYELQLLVINQDRIEASRDRLRAAGPLEVLEYPRNEQFFSAMGHDHPWVLDQSLAKVTGDLLVVFDSDAHPIQDHWLTWVENQLKTYDAICAEDHIRPGNPHPCFMAFTRNAYETGISFSDGVLDNKIDTGRRIRKQLESKGMSCRLIPSEQSFCKVSGVLYENMIYHHGSGTFHASGEKRLLDQVHVLDQRVKQLVLKDRRYDFGFGEKFKCRMKKGLGEFTKSFRR